VIGDEHPQISKAMPLPACGGQTALLFYDRQRDADRETDKSLPATINYSMILEPRDPFSS
jgi:hypothetical protein